MRARPTITGGTLVGALILTALTGGCFAWPTIDGGPAELAPVRTRGNPNDVADSLPSAGRLLPEESEIVVLKFYDVDDYFGERLEWAGIEALTAEGGTVHYAEHLDLDRCHPFVFLPGDAASCGWRTRHRMALGFVEGHWPRFIRERGGYGEKMPPWSMWMALYPRTYEYSSIIARGTNLRPQGCLFPAR